MRRSALRNLAAVVALAASLVAVAGSAGSVVSSNARGPSDVPHVAWFPDGSVDAMARVGRTLYLAGSFDRLVEMGGSLSTYGLNEGATRDAPKLWGGPVVAVAADGDGGSFVGGSFNGADGSPCRHFSRVTDAGNVDRAWCGVVNGQVYATAVAGRMVYVGGAFARARGVQRRGLVGLDRRSARVAAWRPTPQPCGDVLAVTVASGRVYASEAGRRCERVSAYDVRTGRRIWTTKTDVAPYVLAAGHGRLYAGGSFGRIGGRRRRGLAALDPRTGRVTAWRADVRERYGPSIYALALRGATVFVGGNFEFLGGELRGGLGAVDRGGRVLPWNPLTGEYDWVSALHVRGDSVFVAGSFNELAGEPRQGVGVVDAVTGRALEWRPATDVQRWIFAIGSSGTTVSLGGDAVTTGRSVRRSNLAAIDAVTGLPLPWSPQLKGGVSALVADERAVYVGGNFTLAGARNLAALTPDASASLRWGGETDDPVRALALANGTLYVGGRFHTIGGVARGRLAAVDVDDGRVQAWAPTVGEDETAVRSIAVAATSVFVGGTFAAALARVDRQTGSVLPWNTRVGGRGEFPVEALVLDGDTLYVGGAFERIGGKKRSCLAALDASSASVRAWAPRLESIPKDFLGVSDECTVDAVAVTASEVVFGGAFSFVGGRPHVGLAAVDRRSAAPLAWRPSTGCREVYEPGFPSVGALVIAENVAHAGGFFNPTGCESGAVGLMLFTLANGGG